MGQTIVEISELQPFGVLGLDLGSVNVKAAWLSGPNAEVESAPIPSFCAPAKGRPLVALEGLVKGSLNPLIGGEPLYLSLTGVSQDLLARAVPATRTNEVVATALAVAAALPGTRTIVDVGGQFTKWILLDGDQVADFAINGLCAAGSGAFLEQQATRLKLSVEELGMLASTSPRGAPVAGRCSVFAKSDMIHLQQKGTPIDEIAYGVCLALVRTFVATVLGGRVVKPPVAIVGGGSANPGLVRAFQEVLGLKVGDITVPHDQLTLGARGAALAVEPGEASSLEQLLSSLASTTRSVGGHEKTRSEGPRSKLLPLARWHKIPVHPDEDPPRETIVGSSTDGLVSSHSVKVCLGVDVGSVSTNVVVLDAEGGHDFDMKVIQGIYLPTRGRPIEVLDEALSLIKAKFGDDLDVLAVGATGSGRHLAARSVGADTVKNEITAQMASAAAYFPEVDTVFEIGGQDSKYIGARDGRLTDFEMNKICAAGTGSFLEEQAERLDVRIKGDFSKLALDATDPQDLGSRCTVFMDTELVRAQQMGVTREDICAGLAYSIARNYLEKVVTSRPVGETVVFQGGTASNDAVVAALRALTGKRVVVHPYNRISGAIGAALLAAREHLRYRGQEHPSRFRGYDACRDAKARSFECKKCPNRCQVIRVEVGGLVSHFGDTCERYTEKDGQVEARTTPRRDLFAERAALLEAHLPPRRHGRPRALLPRASHMLEIAPFWGAILDALGYDVALTPPSSIELISKGGSGFPNELCLPVKMAAGHVRRALVEDTEAIVVLPSVLELPDSVGDGQSHACLYSQELPNLLHHTEGGRLIVPQCSLASTRGGLFETESELVRCFGVSRRTARKAMALGRKAQTSFDEARRKLGREALKDADGGAIVVLGRPYNLHDPLLNLDLAKRLAKLPFLAVPMDLLPTEDVKLNADLEGLMWRYSRDQLRALEYFGLHRFGDSERQNVFPLWVSCFGCGPDAFAYKYFDEHVKDIPALMLEFDEHRGEAGLITRLEAFTDEIQEHLRKLDRPRKTSTLCRHKAPALSGRIFVPHISEHAHAIAAALRSVGSDAIVLPKADETTIALGEEVSGGGECHPWVVMAGELVRWATSGEGLRGDTFYYPQAENPCLICQYGHGHQHILERLGLDGRYRVMAFPGPTLVRLFGCNVAMRMYEGIAAIDLLMAAACCRRPYEHVAGTVDQVFDEGVQAISEAVAHCESALPPFSEAISHMMDVPIVHGERRPIVGVCGDFYTRINPLGNANLFARLEALGCQVWPHTYLSGLFDYGLWLDLTRWVERGQLGRAMFKFVNKVGAEASSRPLQEAVPEEIAHYCVVPEPDHLQRIATPYIGPRTNYLISENVARMVDFVRRGADGVLSAVGIGCMVGVSADGAMARIRSDFPDIPMVTLSYGCTEGPAQRIKLETFVHQVHNAAQRRRNRS